MPTFTPVDYDPFAPVGAPGGAPSMPPAAPASTAPQAVQSGDAPPLTIRGGKAQSYTLTPVDYDPFADAPKGIASRAWDTAADLAQSAATGIEKGAIGLATLPVTLGGLGEAIVSKGMDLALGPKPAQPAPEPGSLHDMATNPGNYLSVAGAERAADAMGVPFYQPQTTAGRYAETVGEFLPGATNGGVAGALKYAVAPGLASEAAGQATQGTALEPYARVAAPILTGALAGVVSPSSADRMMRQAASNTDASTLNAAQDLMDAARQQGSPLSLAEAVQQVTNGATRLGSMQRVVEQSRGGADTMAQFYANRPQQVQQAGHAAIDRVGTLPVVPQDGSFGPIPPSPSQVAPGVQRAAQGYLDATPQAQDAAQAMAGAGPRITPEQAGQVIQPALGGVYDQRLGVRSAQARQDYAAAGGDTVPSDQIGSIIADLDDQIAKDKTGLLAEQLGGLRQRLVDRTRPASDWQLDPAADASVTGQPTREFSPPDEYQPRQTGLRPAVPKPTSLVNFLQSAGGVRDPGGDLKAMGLDRFPGLVRTTGGLSPDMARQAAAQAGYLGPDIDLAMANTTPNDLFDALDRHPHYSVHDDDAVHAWEAYEGARADRDRMSGPTSRSAPPPRAPGLPDPGAGPAQAEQITPITDIENLNRVRKHFRERIDLPPVNPRSIDKETAAKMGPVLQNLDAVMGENSAAYRLANENFQRNSVPLAPFEHTPALAGAVERDPYGTRYMMPAEQVPGAIEGGGSSAARAFTGVAPDPARQAYASHLTTRLLDQASGPGGAIDTGRLARAVYNHADTLQHFPEVQQRVQRVIDTQRALEPLGDTLVGKLAASPSSREQAALILSPNPVPGSAAEVSEAVRQVAERAPDAARALVSQHIRQVFNEATQTNMGGSNQWGGAKFNALIRGNTQQARNLKAAVEALQGPGVWRDFQKTLDVFEAMGRRQAPGSQTEFNKQLTAEMQKGGKLGSLATVAASPTALLSKAHEVYREWTYGRRSEALATFLTRPDAARVLASIAKREATSSATQGMAAGYLLNSAANQARKAIEH